MQALHNILNTANSNILQKIFIEKNNTIVFYFGDIPNWRKIDTIWHPLKVNDYYEAIEVRFNLSSNDLAELYWKVRRYAGEEMFLQVKENELFFWQGEISDYEEYWGTFDDLEEGISISDFKKTNEPKAANDWRNDYENLRANFHSLYNKKSSQLSEFREKVKLELKEKIGRQFEQKEQMRKHYIHPESFSKDDLMEIIDSALSDLNNGIKIDLFVDFLYDRNHQ